MSALRARSAECRVPSSMASPADLRGIGAAAFHKLGIAVLPIHELPEMDRMLVEQICESRYGKRGKHDAQAARQALRARRNHGRRVTTKL